MKLLFRLLGIQIGDVFTFYIEEKKQYGLMQVFAKGKTGGYHVRVFYDLLNDIATTTVASAIESTGFYYICNFYPSTLVSAGKKAGRFPIPPFVSTPKYMRDCERKHNGDLHWYVMEDLRLIKTYKTFDETLKPLSPAVTWGIQSIKKCWLDGFTLENWHELEDKWYMDYLKVYEPDKLPKSQMGSIIQQWAQTGRLSNEALQKLELLFGDFTKQLSQSQKDTSAVDQAIVRLIEGINAWNLQYSYIETEEREDLMDYIQKILEANHCADTCDTIGRLRQW